MPRKPTPQVRPDAPEQQNEPAAPPAAPNALTTAAAVRAEIDERLADGLKDFVAGASPEEKRIMVEILENRDNTAVDLRRELGGRQYEVGLLTGFQKLTTWENILVVPDDLVRTAEHAIRDLVRQRDMETARKPYSADDIRVEWQKELQASFDLFLGKATTEEIRFLARIFYSWEEYLDTEESGRPALPIVEAARYQLGRANKATDETLSKSMGDFVSELIGQGNALIESASTLKEHIAKVKRSSV